MGQGSQRPGRPVAPLTFDPAERATLEQWAYGQDRRLGRRAALLLAAADGMSNKAVAARFRVSKQTVGKWRTRFQQKRLQGLLDEPRTGAPRRIHADEIARVIALSQTPPPNGTRWTTRALARVCGLSQTAVSRIWRANRLGSSRAATRPPEPSPRATSHPIEDSAAEVEAAEDRLDARDLRELVRELERMATQAPPEAASSIRVALEATLKAVETVAARRPPLPGSPLHRLSAQVRSVRERAWQLVRDARAMAADARARSAARDRQPALRCPGCGRILRLRFDLSGPAARPVTTTIECAWGDCRQPVPVEHPENAGRVRFE